MNNITHNALNIVIVTVIFFIILTTSVPVWSKDVFTINQKDHKFSELFLKIKNDDVLKFVNLDSVNHRLVFTHKDQQEQMNTIKPGKSQEVTFKSPGIYDIQCKIHPEMKLTIFIPYVAKLTKAGPSYTF